MKTRQKTQTLGDVLKGLVQDLGISERIGEYDAVLQWEVIVGEHIAKVAQAERISQGVLVVRVKTSTWRQELNMRKGEMIGLLNRALGGDVVKDIRFR
jgi:predicted nucleic acid-binding Zn ribbon protein